AGSMLGFLVWNFYPAKIFLGEGGSLFAGFMLGVLAVIAGGKIAIALLVIGLPALDLVWIIFRRVFWERHSLALADRKHLHFRLLDLGLTERQAVLLLYLFAVLFGGVALFLPSREKLVALGILIVLMIILSVLTVIWPKKDKSNQK
ncbi:MAG: undecaprenyl/decaprenyl-phosphate alpha-N-acetylglucosaminyl 1-phosphate transferase, partial [Fibrobacterota bacterium]